MGKVNKQAGFTLIELLIVSAVTVIISVSLITNFVDSQKSQSLNNAVALFNADIRKAQSLTNSTLQFQGLRVCGYGLHYASLTSYVIYTIPRALGIDCSILNHNYNSSRDFIYEIVNLKVVNIAMNAAFQDIFFEPPDLKVYIDNRTFPPQPPTNSTRATFCFTGDSINCRSLEILLSGQINSI